LPYNDFSANGNYPLNFVSQSKGALQIVPPIPIGETRARISLFTVCPKM